MKEKKNIENLNWEILAKYFTKEINPGEKAELENWTSVSDENKMEMEKTQKMVDDIDAFYQTQKIKTNAAWKNVQSKLNPLHLTTVQPKKVRKEVFAQFYKYAAILVMAILLGSLGYFVGIKNQIPFQGTEMVSSGTEVLNELKLPDGTLVSLNSYSKLEFPKKFKGQIREVSIQGEAFFDVTPNPEKPFIINAGNTQVKVLGTSFSVCAYPENEKVEVVVKTGKVELAQKTGDNFTGINHIFLTPGEKGTFFMANNSLKKSMNKNQNYLAWKTHDLIFNETPLVEVIDCLNKAYHTKIQLNNEALKSQLYTAHFDKKPLDFVLDVMQISFNLEISKNNEQITLSSRINEQVKH